MKSLVTGANGFVGSAVARCLLNAGHEVRCLVRPGSDRRNLQTACRALGRRFALGSVIEARGGRLRQPVSCCRRLSPLGSNPETMYDINVRGTQALILAAAEAGVKRMIYTSSVATLGTNQDGIPANEETPPVL